MKLKKGIKFQISPTTTVEIVSASNSGINKCKVKDCTFSLHYNKIVELINVYKNV